MPRTILKLPAKADAAKTAKSRSSTVRPVFGAKRTKNTAEASAAVAPPTPALSLAVSAADTARAESAGVSSRQTHKPRAAMSARPPQRSSDPPPRPRRAAPPQHAAPRKGDTDLVQSARKPPAAARSGDATPSHQGVLSTKQRFYATAGQVPAAASTRSRAGRHQEAAAATSELPRLSKLMSERELCSRREADEWISHGWVQVDGKVVDTLGTRVSPDARIEIDPLAAKRQGESVTILLNKPLGYVSGQAEDNHQPAMTLLRGGNRWREDGLPLQFRPAQLRGLAPAGRLDIDSTGLLVFTQDGRVARKLIGDDSSVEKEYLVRVEGTLSPQALRLLNHGLSLDGAKLKPAKVSWQNEDQLRFVLREGKKRQIRRMCELVGLKVTGLKRVRIGSVALGKLPPGKWRYLRPDERF